MHLFPKTLFRFAAANKKPKSFYQTLQVPRTATSQEIKSSYYKLAKQYHPDTHQQKSNVAESFKLINEAYNILKDPIKRKQYDEQNFTSEGEKKQYKFYNTQHNYGYGAGNAKTYRKNPYQSTNPFQSTFNQQNPFRQGGSTNPYNSDFSSFYSNKSSSTQQSPNPGQNWDEYVRNQHRKNIAQNRKTALDRIKRSNTIIIIILGLTSVYIVGQLTFKIYEFNGLHRVRSYPQRLDPNQLKQYQQLTRNVARKDYY